jgi:hypothetical protein
MYPVTRHYLKETQEFLRIAQQQNGGGPFTASAARGDNLVSPIHKANSKIDETPTKFNPDFVAEVVMRILQVYP